MNFKPIRSLLNRLVILIGAAQLILAHADTTIDPARPFSYGANIGWINWSGDTNQGAVIGEYVCSGFLYSASVGWINLGNGSPANGIQYQNASATDFGVNLDGLGNLRGFAYGANVGWINFENLGAPQVDLLTGVLRGCAYSANCGWISLSNALASVQTRSIARGADLDSDAMPDAWERIFFGNLAVNAGADADNDGASNLHEYVAGTNPTNAVDTLRITFFRRGTPNPGDVTLSWLSQPTRFYAVQYRWDLTQDSWSDWTLFYYPGVNNAQLSNPSQAGFYRVRAFRPLMP